MDEMNSFTALKRQTEMSWDQPLPLDGFTKPPFPITALPIVLQEHTRAIAEMLQMMPDMPALHSLAAISTACSGKIDIEAHSGWIEPIQTYSLVCLGVGERKSAAIKLACAPIIEWQAKETTEKQVAIEQSKSKRRMLEKQLTRAEGSADENEAMHIIEKIADFNDVYPTRILADDITPEALSRIMSQNNGCAAIWSAEGGFVSMLGGRYSKDGNPNIDIVLKAHPGDTVFIDRVGRASEAIENPALTLMLSVQHDVLEELMGNKAFMQRGLCGRFLYSIPESLVGKRKVQTTPIPSKLAAEYSRIVTLLLDIPYPEKRHLLRLSKEASSLFDDWGMEIEPKLVDEWQYIGGWANKLQGLTLRLAGQLHMAAYRSWEPSISGKTMENAIAIGRYAVSHALAAFGSVGLDSCVCNARRIIKAIQEKSIVDFSKREIMRLVRSIKTTSELEKSISLLEEYGYIRMDVLAEDGTVGRPRGARWIASPYITNENRR